MVVEAIGTQERSQFVPDEAPIIAEDDHGSSPKPRRLVPSRMPLIDVLTRCRVRVRRLSFLFAGVSLAPEYSAFFKNLENLSGCVRFVSLATGDLR